MMVISMSCAPDFQTSYHTNFVQGLIVEKYHQFISYHLKSVIYSTSPFQRVNSVNCSLLFKQPVKARTLESEVMCSACKR